MFQFSRSSARRCVSACLMVVVGSCGLAMAQAPMDPPAIKAPNRYANNLRLVRDILKGENGQTKIADGQCLQLNDGNYLGDTTANANAGFLNMKTVSFTTGVTVRSGTRRYKGYGATNGGLTTGGAILKKLLLDTVTGVTFDGLAIHRGNGGDENDPCVHYQSSSKLTFRCMELYGRKPSGTEANWKSMTLGSSYNNEWLALPQAIRRNSGTCSNVTVEYCLTRFTKKCALYLEFTPNCIVRRNALTYVGSDQMKVEGMTNSTIEDNIFYKTFSCSDPAGSGYLHGDGIQGTAKTANSVTGLKMYRNIFFDGVGRSMQGIFMEQDGTYTGPKSETIENNIFFIATAQTGNALGLNQSGGSNKVRYNTVIADCARGTKTPNLVTKIVKRSTDANPTGDEMTYNISDAFDQHGGVLLTGNKTVGEASYTSSHFYAYTAASSTPINGLLASTDGVGTFKFVPSVLQKLSWKVGSTLTDPNYNGGAGAWRAFQAYGAVPPGWVKN